jgi:hypothetical protein
MAQVAPVKRGITNHLHIYNKSRKIYIVRRIMYNRLSIALPAYESAPESCALFHVLIMSRFIPRRPVTYIQLPPRLPYIMFVKCSTL